jgi:uncharacterized coiled-coil protein SlyX
MKPESIIVNLSGVVAKQNQMLNEAQSSIEFLRECKQRLEELSTKQQKEIEAQNSLVAEQSVKIANLQNEIEILTRATLEKE